MWRQLVAFSDHPNTVLVFQEQIRGCFARLAPLGGFCVCGLHVCETTPLLSRGEEETQAHAVPTNAATHTSSTAGASVHTGWPLDFWFSVVKTQLARVGVVLPHHDEVPVLEVVGQQSLSRHVRSDLGPMRLWITGESGATAERLLCSATSVEMNRYAMVEMDVLLATALR